MTVGGAWTIQEAPRLDGELRGLDTSGKGAITIDASPLERLDSAGAWLLLRTKRALESAGRTVSALKLPDLYTQLLDNLDQGHKAPPVRMRAKNTFRDRLERIVDAPPFTPASNAIACWDISAGSRSRRWRRSPPRAAT